VNFLPEDNRGESPGKWIGVKKQKKKSKSVRGCRVPGLKTVRRGMKQGGTGKQVMGGRHE